MLRRSAAVVSPSGDSSSSAIAGTTVLLGASVVVCAVLYILLKRTESRAAAAEQREAEAQIRNAAALETARARAAAGAREMLNAWDTDRKGYVLAKDILDVVRGRRDPNSPWAEQKSKWPPQRMAYVAERFADGHDKRFGPAQLEQLARYMQDNATHALADELNYAWEQVDKLRHKTNSRESLLPATQLRGGPALHANL
jgi:hypothetical protein